MAALRELRRFTPEEYLAVEERAETRSEYLDGQIFMMADGSPRHSQVANNVATSLTVALRATPCRVFNSDLRVLVQHSGFYTYPDVSVICGKTEFAPSHTDTVINPIVIVQVLSASTRDHDMGYKFELYRGLPSLQHYLLIEADKAYVHYFRKVEAGQWLMIEVIDTSGAIELTGLGIPLPLADIYDKVDFAEAGG
jgi:Uma2 family endonuclease